MPIDSVPDHVAVAVPSIDAAGRRWRDQLGGAWCSTQHDEGSGFATRQLWYRGGAKLELLQPVDEEGFAAGFLARFGARVHHVTLRVPDLFAAVDELRAAGYDVVDIDTTYDHWHEAFLRPSQVGGIIVQIARSTLTVQDWADRAGYRPEPQPTDGARLLGPTIFHPDLDACERVWRVLGGSVERDDEVVRVRWPGHPLTVHVQRGDRDLPPTLRFEAAPPLGADPDLGPGVEVVDGSDALVSDPPD